MKAGEEIKKYFDLGVSVLVERFDDADRYIILSRKDKDNCHYSGWRKTIVECFGCSGSQSTSNWTEWSGFEPNSSQKATITPIDTNSKYVPKIGDRIIISSMIKEYDIYKTFSEMKMDAVGKVLELSEDDQADEYSVTVQGMRFPTLFVNPYFGEIKSEDRGFKEKVDLLIKDFIN